MVLSDEERRKIEEEEEHREKVRGGVKRRNKNRNCLGCLGFLALLILIPFIFSGGTNDTTPSTYQEGDQQATIELSYAIDMRLIAFDHVDKGISIVGLLLRWDTLTDDEVVLLGVSLFEYGNDYDDALELSPPESLESTHRKFLKGYKLHKDAVEIIPDALGSSNAADINEATEMIEDGGTLLDEAIDTLKEKVPEAF